MKFLAAILALALIPAVALASCNIDTASEKSYSTSDGQVIAQVGVTSTFRLGCSQGTPVPKLHAEHEGQYVHVTQASHQSDLYEVSFVEELAKSSSRWIEIKVYDDATYSQLLAARSSSSRTDSYKPLKTINVSHYGVSKGPMARAETLVILGLLAIFSYAHTMKSRITH